MGAAARCVALLLIVASASATSSQCTVGQSCQNDGPRSGGAMLQKTSTEAEASEARGTVSAEAKTKSAPLKGRVDTMEAEVISLKARLAKLQADVGSGGEGGVLETMPVTAPEVPAEMPPPPEIPAEEAALLAAAKSKRKYVSLVEV